MKYFIFAPFLLFYFELLGRYFFYKIKKSPLDFSFVMGFLLFIGALYIIGWPISAFNRPSIYYVYLISILFLITVVLIIKNIRKISFCFNKKLWIIFFVLLLFEIIISLNRTLGQPHGFDALYYINYIGFNVDTNSLNSLHPHFGTSPNTYKDTITYVFQSYNYFISAFVFIAKKLFGLVSKTIDFLPLYVWTFQIILHAFFISTSLMVIKELEIKSKILNISLVILLILFMDNIYYNNCYGFIGNNFRMSIHAIATIYLFRYFASKDKRDLFLFFISMIGMCGFSSTGTFATIFVLFGLFFFLYNKEKNLLKYYSVVMYIPTINILMVKLGIHWYIAIFVFVVFAAVYYFNDQILHLFENAYVRYSLIILVAAFIIVMSIIVSGEKSIFHYFINNYSERQDMSWDYFDFKDLKHWIFNLIVLVPMFFHLFENKKHPFSIIAIVLILTVFNPLGGNFMNKINWVYYRTYDIIVNQFTIAYFLNYLIMKINYNKLIISFVCIESLFLAIVQIPSFWHESFIPDDDYNKINKIENSELELITNVRQMICDNNIENPAIISPTFYMSTYIKDSTYLIGKEKRYNYDNFSELTYELYKIFFPVDYDYDNFRPSETPDYDNVIEYLKESNYDILIVDYNNFINYKGEFISMVEAVTSDGTYKDSKYSTSRYAVIYLH